MNTPACKSCQSTFQITTEDQQYYAYMKVPAPTLCATCRAQRRAAWRNERTLYRRKCDATGEKIISVFSRDKPHKVYNNDHWYGDQWDAKDYGRDYDFNRPFFEQFAELLLDCPQLARSTVNNQNSDYVNQAGWNKNCYLIFEADYCENCLYSNNITDSKSSVDLYHCNKCELCYECINCKDSYNLKYSQDSQNCSDSYFLKNCIGCRDCFGCVNLKNKRYYFLNEKLTKEQYEGKITALKLHDPSTIEQYRQKFTEFTKQFPQRYMQGVQNENSTGNYLNNTQNCENCFDVINAQDCKNIYYGRNLKKVYDMTVFGSAKGAEFCYENHEIGEGVKQIYFSDQVWDGCYDIYYSKLCLQNCHHLFGCASLKHQSYCILNKQYTREEYESLVPRIIEHMKSIGEFGEFFPAGLSPFGYNETIANDYWPLTEQQAAAQSFNWKQPEPPLAAPAESSAQTCTSCQKPFKFVEAELQFYTRQNLPRPTKCHDCRHRARFALRNPQNLYDRTCQKCQIPLRTTYAPGRPEKVYCEKCYLGNL